MFFEKNESAEFIATPRSLLRMLGDRRLGESSVAERGVLVPFPLFSSYYCMPLRTKKIHLLAVWSASYEESMDKGRITCKARKKKRSGYLGGRGFCWGELGILCAVAVIR